MTDHALDLGALACITAGLLAGVLTYVATQRVRLTLAVALEFWTAAGMLQLARSTLDWSTLTTAAAILGVRQLVGLALRTPH